MPRSKRIGLENKGYGYKAALSDVIKLIDKEKA
jgi:hypothetical protein